MSAARIKRLKKVTKTISVSVSFTLAFRLLPNVLNVLFRRENIFQAHLIFLYDVSMVNQIANFFIYAWHFEDIRAAYKALVCCKSKIETNTNQIHPQDPGPAAANAIEGHTVEYRISSIRGPRGDSIVSIIILPEPTCNCRPNH